jgi:23S rRNA pseudouridine2605 synthase
VEREYVATVDGEVDAESLGSMLSAGVETIEDGEPLVVSGRLLSVDGADVRLVVTEGKHRMVRRMLANCGHPVRELRRERYGDIWLGELGGDCAREISGEELDWVKRWLSEP